MKITFDHYRFRQMFEDLCRDSKYTDAAMDAIFDYYTEYEKSTGEEIEFDCIGICCTFTEYTADELTEEYSDLVDDDDCYDTPEARLDAIIEALQKETTVIAVNDDSFLVMAY
ncbi:hypothetical protein AGMMS49992_30540 [Clostridia bacterium]|nr:hypothetical protein AGMMS49992_30540 [Clostridia bacterium]